MSGHLDVRQYGRMRGRELRDTAMNQVEQHSPIESSFLYDVACKLARTRIPFTSDDVWDAAGISVREPRVMGPVMRKLAHDGLAVKTGRVRQGHRGVNHARPQVLWIGL